MIGMNEDVIMDSVCFQFITPSTPFYKSYRIITV